MVPPRSFHRCVLIHPRRQSIRPWGAALQLAEARYAQGLGSQIELADAGTAVTTAEGNLVTAELPLATAAAQRHRATMPW